MSDAVPDLSPMCARSEHRRCPHMQGARLPRPWRRQADVEVRLCRCPCHALCPLAADLTVTRGAWDAACTCPGADRLRRGRARSAEQREELRRIAAEVDMSGHPDAEEIETRLRAVFEEHGQPPPPGMTTWSQVLAARATRRGTRTLRVPGMGEVPAGYPVAGAVAAVAAVLTGGAIASSGRRRRVLGLSALTAWLASGYAVSSVTALGQFSRWAEDHPRAQDLPSR